MATVAEDIEARLRSSLQATEVVVTDVSASKCGSAFDVEVVAPVFEGKSLLQRHRLVNDALRDVMPTIHALSIKRTVPP